ncbi:reverse transcriptase domain-containing protein, partial [Vibrio vulnificus]
NGGVRQLGIPTVLDRIVQQAITSVLSGIYEPTFSNSSYGFRPNRSAHHALAAASRYIREGRGYVVDIDLAKYFDTVNHDRLMHRLSKDISDKRVLKLIRSYLQAGLMRDGLVERRQRGTPQGGPLSPLLSNIVLDELDKELERRGHKFCRYADDCQIYVRSEEAAHRVKESITEFLEQKLKLTV